MQKLEKHFESLLQNFPNLLTPELCGKGLPVIKKFGAVKVCVRQGPLPECDGKADLAFITEEAIYLAELKRNTINRATLDQVQRYAQAIGRRYPHHKIQSFLVGHFCPDEKALSTLIGSDPIKILLFYRDIPWWTEVKTCGACGAGAGQEEEVCPCCRRPLA